MPYISLFRPYISATRVLGNSFQALPPYMHSRLNPKILRAQQSPSTHTLSAYLGPPVTGRRAAPVGVPGLLRSVHADPPARVNSCMALKVHIAWPQPAFLTFLPKLNMASSVHS